MMLPSISCHMFVFRENKSTESVLTLSSDFLYHYINNAVRNLLTKIAYRKICDEFTSLDLEVTHQAHGEYLKDKCNTA